MAQVAREKALTKFRENKIRVLVATDVAARGIDVQGVSHVINYTCPEDEKTYIHRIGRTGRAGATGIAVTFVDWADLHRWKMINKALDLPFDEPQETYSTSEHLFHDLGIPAGTKGRIVAADARSRRSARAASPTVRAASVPRAPRRGSAPAPAAGEQVAAGTAEKPGAPAEQPAAGERPASQSRTRRRRRRSGSSSGSSSGSTPRPDRRVVLCRPGGGSGDDDDLGADRGEVPQRDRVRHVLPDAAVRLRRPQLGARSAGARRSWSGSSGSRSRRRSVPG